MHLEKQFKSNEFKKRIKIDKTNHISERRSLGFSEDKFDFSEALKSINLSYLEFTNFFPNKKDVKFKFFRIEYNRLLNCIANLDDEYEMKVVNTEDGFNELKLKMIYSDTCGKEIREFPLMYKLKNLRNEEIQFYVISKDEIYKVCFIDIYHLAIPTKEQDATTKYIINSGNRYGLDNLKDTTP